MIENTLQHTLSHLRAQVDALQSLSGDDARQLKQQVQQSIAGLRRTLQKLQSIVAEASETPGAASSEPAIDAPPYSIVNTAANVAGQSIAEQQLRRYQERLRALSADLLLTEELERRRLAIDLHDGLSQTIALTQMKLSELRQSVDGKLMPALEEIEELIHQTNLTTRSISFELSPPVLHDLGLGPAIRWLVENIQSRYDLKILLEDDQKPKPTDHRTRVILFRSIRELLINAAKHSGTQRVRVRLLSDEEQLDALVEDDGVGMDPEQAFSRGSGLFSIRERLTHVGGSMRIDSDLGRGTKIRLCAPLLNDCSSDARLEA